MHGFFAGRTLAGLGDDLRSGRTTAAELLGRALESIDPALNAFVTVDAGGAASAARRADADLAGGADHGPLHGVPVAIKDIVDVAGLPSGMGSAHFRGHLAAEDAECVRRLRAAGAVIVGKTVTHEFAAGSSGDVSADGPSRNPRDPERISGGSSGGSAVAVAAGMVPLALGTDTGGSIRIPAALCGIAGFKPAYGEIPADGVFPMAVSLDHVGVLAATAADCRTAYRVLTGRAADGVTANGRAADGRAESAPRVCWIEPPQVDAEVGRVARAAFPDAPAERLDLAPLLRTFSALQAAETYDVHAERVAAAPELFQPEVLGRLRRMGEVPAWKYVRAVRDRDRFAREVAGLLARHDVLALPTVPLTAVPIGTRDSPFGPLLPALMSLTCPWNALGLPALSVPAGTSRGLPVGVQLVTRAGAEDLLFAAAERVTAGSSA
ncbi:MULTISPECIES: amidase [Thermomonosporaceae]|uniref:amidase n=1 Tax=Thermomonosporaceae TaxID=2012 RepID=UPI00255A9DE9|nr:MULTISPECIES: amidase [Thermomonosporaceae]MDL4772413.1 amidase [Actinomadura xylanilytica]